MKFSSLNIKIKHVQYALWRGIEVVITGLTRNFVATLELSASNLLIYKGFPQFKYNLIA